MASTAPPSGPRPGPHPEPTTKLDDRRLPLVQVPVGDSFFRMHPIARDPLRFSRSGLGRFDAPGGEFGIVYAGADVHCAFIETFGRDLGFRLVSRAELEARSVALIRFDRPMRLVDLTGPGLAVLGADARLCTGDYAVAQRWSLALWQHPDQPDGLLWRSRFDPSRTSIGLYDRAQDALNVTAFGSLAGTRHARLLADVLDTYQIGYVESS